MGAHWDHTKERLSRFHARNSEKHPALWQRLPDVGLALVTLGGGGAVGWFAGVTTATTAIATNIDIWTPGSLAFLSAMGFLFLVGFVLWLAVPKPDGFQPIHKRFDEHEAKLDRIEGLLSKPVETEVGSSAPNPERNPVVVFPALGTVHGTFTASGAATVIPPPERPPSVS